MSKSSDEHDKAKKDRKLDDEALDATADEGEDEAAAAKPLDRPRPRRREHAASGHGHGAKHAPEAEPAEAEDPGWWMPHAVLSVLVLIGLFGFFGAFNSTLGFLAAKPPAHAAEHGGASASAHATPPPPAPNPGGPKPEAAPQAPREMFGAKHLLVMHKGSRRAPATIQRSQDEAKARATEAMKKAKEGKVKFEDLVKEYSDEPGAGDRGGDLGKFPKGAMVPEFQAGLEKIKVGEISDLVETPFGYHVILRTQ